MDPRLAAAASRPRRSALLPAGLLLGLAMALPACRATVDGAESSPPGSDSGSAPVAAGEATPDPTPVTEYQVEVIATHPHDTGAWTQGLEVVGDQLLESTGLEGASTIRIVDPRSGDVVRSAALEPELFGEGTTVVDDEIWQLTWKNQTLLVHGLADLEERRRIAYEGEGWGLCATGDHLVMSDGSERLTMRDRETFDPLGSVTVLDGGDPVDRLNELECVDGVVWANVYRTTRLVAIDPADGRVVGRADLTELVPPGFEGKADQVANGIAHDPATGHFWLTGKLWPVLYEVDLVPAAAG